MSTNGERPDGGELLARTLREAGVDTVFALHGGHLEAFYRGCLRHGLGLLDFRHEAPAGNAADAYARATGDLGVCVVTAGPGFANVMPAIINAQLDASPVLFIVGAPPLREAETNPLQGGFDQVAVATPATQWSHRVTNTERIPDLTAEAIRKATRGRRGAVLLELPIDVLHLDAPESRVAIPSGLAPPPRPAPSPQDAERAVAILRQAERPVIIAGGDARFSDCGAALRRFAERSGIPVFCNTRSMGLLPSGHPLDGHEAHNLAALGLMERPVPDAVLLLGARLGLFLGGRRGDVVPLDARLIQVHSDATEIGRLRDVELPVAADARATLEALEAASAQSPWPDWSAWAREAAGLKALMGGMYPETDTDRGVHPFHAASAVAEAAGPEAAWAIDGGEAASWTSHHVRVGGPGRVMSHGYLGCLGVGPGFAIGLQTAHPDRRVVHVTGDGAMGFHIQEFDTMVRHALPIVTVVLNNRVWGMSIHGQQIMYGKDYDVITRLGETPYAEIARAFGCHGEVVEKHADIGPAMERALASGKPACVEIMVDGEVVHPGTIAMLGEAAAESGEVLMPYYENTPADER